MTSKMIVELKGFPKNKEPRAVYITDEIMEILKEREAFRLNGCDYLFHVEGKPLNYGTIQINYRGAQRKGRLPYSGTHILRHGMATLARKVGGGLDAVIAMTGHKDIKLADHYSKCDEEDQQEISKAIFAKIATTKAEKMTELESQQITKSHDNIIYLSNFAKRA
jgi:integrase